MKTLVTIISLSVKLAVLGIIVGLAVFGVAMLFVGQWMPGVLLVASPWCSLTTFSIHRNRHEIP